MSKELKVILLREFTIIFVMGFIFASPFSLINKEWGEVAGRIVGFIYGLLIFVRLGMHGIAYALESWDLGDSRFVQTYVRYLYWFHFIFRPLYRFFDVPVPYAELDQTFRGRQNSKSRQKSYGNTYSSQNHSHYSRESDETEQQRYERRKREREQQRHHQKQESHGYSFGGSRFSQETFERDGKVYNDQGEELTWMFTTLGVSYTCSYEEAEKAYKALVKQYHPDMVARSGPKIREAAERETKEINRAWDAVKTLFSEAKHS